MTRSTTSVLLKFVYCCCCRNQRACCASVGNFANRGVGMASPTFFSRTAKRIVMICVTSSQHTDEVEP